MYVLADIDRGGFIRLLDGYKTVHRETRSIGSLADVRTYRTITSGKEAFLSARSPERKLLLHLDREGGVDLIWVHPKDKDEVNQRLKIWSGCYGKWPVKEFNV